MTAEMYRVLLVEDNLDHALLMGECLEEAGYQVVRAQTGAEGLVALEAEKPNLVVLDYSLPRKDGLTVLEEIHSAEKMVPVVMVTAQGSEQVAVAAMKGGAYDYVVKGGDYLQRLPIVARRAIEAHQLAIERKRAEEEIRQRTAQLQALREVGLELTAQLDLEALLHSIVRRAVELLGGTAGGLAIYRPDQDVLDYVVYTGLDSVPSETTLQRGEGFCGTIWKTGAPLIVDDYKRGEERSALQENHLLHVAHVGVPVCWGEDFLGVLDIMADPPRTFSPADAELLNLFATQAAIAIRNARLYEQTQQQSERLAQTLVASQALHRSLGLEQVLQEIAQGVVRALGFRRAVVNVREPEGGLVRPRVVAGLEGVEQERLLGATYQWADFQSLMQERFRLSRSYFIRQGQLDWQREFHGVVVVPHIEDRGPGYWRPEDMLLVPLWSTGSQPLGLLSVDEPLDGRVPDLNTIRVLEIFANQAGIAIENARLYEQVQRRAEELRAAYEQLQRAQKALVQAERLAAMSQIGVTVRHEINNPLTAVLGNAQWLLTTEQTLSADSRDALKEIEMGAIRIRNVVRKLDEIEDRPVPYLDQTMMIDIRGPEKRRM